MPVSLQHPAAARLRSHGAEAVRYVIVGASGYVLGIAIYAGLLALGASPYVALPPAFVLNGLYNFALNRAWTFQASGLPVRVELLRFGIVACATLVANYTTLYVLHDILVIAAVPAQMLAGALVVPVGFLGNKLWSFRRVG
jgi:putative flippase GtrA